MSNLIPMIMKEINDISLPRMNNGAHFTFVSNILARVESDSAVKGKKRKTMPTFHDEKVRIFYK